MSLHGRGLLPLSLALVALLVSAAPATEPARGFTGGRLVARAYDTLLNADFATMPGALATACGSTSVDAAQSSPEPRRLAPPEACDTLEAVALSWRIALDPDDRAFDAEFSGQVDFAIGATEAWTRREPDRAEAWFYLGAAYGARVQWRVWRGERLAAARDGKRIKEALERALTLDPDLHDAKFGIGMYRYYAAVAPTALRMLRWLLMLPGGDRAGGLEQMHAARDEGQLVRGEADYQLHIVYLWYERRVDDALALVESLRARYPRNPLFHRARADILEVYFHDQSASLRAWEELGLRADAGLVNEAALAGARARLQAARLLDALDESDRAAALLDPIVTQRPPRPHGIVSAAETLRAHLRQRLARLPYRLALDGWRAFERGDLDAADTALTQALALEPSAPTTRYRYAQVLTARGRDDEALETLARVLAAPGRPSPIVRANALFDSAAIVARQGDRARARALYLEASQVFGADRRVTERAAQLARE